MPLDFLRSARFGFPYCPAIVFVRRNFLVKVILDRPRLEAFFKIRTFCVYAWRREEKVYFTKCQVTDTAALRISLSRSDKDLRRLYISQRDASSEHLKLSTVKNTMSTVKKIVQAIC